MTWHAELELAQKAAQLAGERLRKRLRESVEVLSAEGRDVKLRADRESESLILQILRQSSVYPILAEESGEHGALAEDALLWIVDPLDGTVNFDRQVPLSSVSVGLWRGQQPILGVVYDFNHDELFAGIIAEGAWCNGQAVAVSGVTCAEKAILTTGFPINRDFNAGPLQRFLSRVQEFKKIRLLGSAALSLAYLASGRVDAYAEEDIMLWDVAAGVAVAQAAGAWVSVAMSERHPWARTVTCAAHEAIFRASAEV